MPKPSSTQVEDYLASLPAEQREALEQVRAAIRAAAPEAEECWSYQRPAFRLDGKVLVAYGASAAHCAFYPMSGTTVAAHASELRDYATSKGTIRFLPGAPLPAALVKRLVQARIRENAGV